ncbi:MAG: M6 family metalloprotease domain-containing protein [Candidatus Aenigmatarchaeota archaeon]
MRIVSVLLALVVFLSVLSISISTTMAVAPSPDVQGKIERGEIPNPFTTPEYTVARTSGLDKPGKLLDLAALAPPGNRITTSIDNTTFKMLLILVDFPNKPHVIPEDFYDDRIFGTTQPSARHFYLENSYGKFDITTVNLPSILGWHTASQNSSFYANGTYGISMAYPNNAQRLAEEAVDLVDSFVNFADYDNDGDGRVEGFTVIHAGKGAEITGNPYDIWSHKWNLRTPLTRDGVIISDYCIFPEVTYDTLNLTIGVVVHEWGHIFGLPDLYDIDGSSRGIGVWGVMGHGSWMGIVNNGDSPSHLSAWSKIQLGFADPLFINSSLTTVQLPASETSNESIYRLWTNNTQLSQYFLVENRQRLGYDIPLRGTGLLIWHIDEAKSSNNMEWYPGMSPFSHFLVALEQADGLWELEKQIGNGDAEDIYPGPTNNRIFDATSIPDSNDYYSNLTGVSISNISNSSMTMTATLSFISLQSDPNELFVSPSSPVYVGNNVVIEIRAKAPLGSNDLHSLQYDIEYNESILSFVSITEGPMLSQSGGNLTFFSYSNVSGLIDNVNITRNSSGVNDNENVTTTITFFANNTGNSFVNITNVGWTNSSGGTPASLIINNGSIDSNTIIPPSVNEIECRINGIWDNLCLLTYGDILNSVRTNCTSQDGLITSVHFRFENIPDSNIFFNQSGTNTGGDIWEYDNPDVTINDSGDFRLNVTCYDDQPQYDIGFVGMFIPWGQLQTTLIDPVVNTNVSKDEFFNFTSNVTCLGGECGSIQAVLDPEEPATHDFTSPGFIFGSCGDGVCNYDETFSSCPSDCETSDPVKLFPEVVASAGKNIITYVNQETRFRGEGYSIDDETLSYQWDFDGDDNFDYESVSGYTTHVYTTAGIYNALLKTSSFAGLSASDTITVEVRTERGEQAEVERPKTTTSWITTAPPDGVKEQYIIMLNGGSDSRYWTDVQQMYPVFINRYGMDPDKIYVINHDGTDPDGNNPNNMIDYSATLDNIDLVFNEIANVIDQDDNLILWISDHGAGYAGLGGTWEGGAYHGFSYSKPEVSPGDEQDYIESNLKLRSLYIGGDYRTNHGMNNWMVRYEYNSSGSYGMYRHIFLSSFNETPLENGTNISADTDIFVERFIDYLMSDLDKNGRIESIDGEVLDYDGDGIPPYNNTTGVFDEDDWGLPDVFVDDYSSISSQTPGSTYCIFDSGLDDRLDIDVDCLCDKDNLSDCNTSLLDVDGTDLDNQGLFDGIDVNDDGDMNDWVSIDEWLYIYGHKLTDDDLKVYTDALDIANIIVYILPCFGGGFIDDLSRSNMIIMAASLEEDVSYGNVFMQLFRDVLNNPSLADVNNDSIATLDEVFNYVSENDYVDEAPQYDDNGDGISSSYPLPNGGDGISGSGVFVRDMSPPAWMKGALSTTIGDTPFYTTDPNPRNTSNTPCLQDMKNGDSCTTTWNVNATADSGSFEFFVMYNATTYPFDVTTNETKHINITSLPDLPPVLTVISPPTPPGFSTILNNDVTFLVNVSDDNNIMNVSFSHSYPVMHVNQTNTSRQQGLYAFNVNLPDFFHVWSIETCDNASQCMSVSDLFTIDSSTTSPVFIPPTPTDGSHSSVAIQVNVSASENIQNVYLETEGNNYSMDIYNPTSAGILHSYISDGVKTYRVYLEDLSGNGNYTETRIVTIDTVTPQVVVFEPQPITYGSNPTLVYSYEEMNLDTCEYSPNGQANQSIACGPNITTISSSEGANNLVLYFTDYAGNVGVDIATWALDTTDPQINYQSSTTSEGNWSQNFIFVNISATDSSLDSVGLNIDGVNETFDIQDGEFYWETKFLGDGFHTFYVWVNDSAGNYAETVMRSVILDTTQPQAVIFEPQSIIYTSNPTLEYSYSDVNPVSCEYNLNNGGNTSITCGDNSTILTSVQSSNDVTFYVTDSFGNTGLDSISWTFDSIPPGDVAGLINDSNGVNFIDWSWTNPVDADFDHVEVWIESVFQTNTTNEYFNASGLSSGGSHTISLRTIDTIGNLGGWVNNTAETTGSDTTPPSLSYVPPTPNDGTEQYSNTASIRVNGDENIDSCVITLDGVNTSFSSSGNYCLTPIGSLSESSHTFFMFVNDSLGNGAVTPLRTLTVDQTEPDISFNPSNPTDNTITSNPSVTISVSANDQNTLDDIILHWNGTNESNTMTNVGGNNWEITKGMGAEESHTYHVWTNDSAGNSNVTETRTIILDSTSPTINYEARTADGYSSLDWIFVNVSSIDANLVSVMISWNGVNETIQVQDGEFYWSNKTGLTDGNYLFYVWVNDSIGNYNQTISGNVTIDFTAPVINVIVPLNTTIFNTGTLLDVTIIESNIYTCVYYLNGAGPNPLLNNCQGDSMTAQEGINVVEVNATDKAGNSAIFTRVFTVNTSPPNGVENLSNSSRGPYSIFWTWTNPTNPNFDHVEIWVDSTFHLNVTNTSLNTTGLSSGLSHEISTRTIDTYGHMNTTWINATAQTIGVIPVVNITHPMNGNSFNVTTINMTYEKLGILTEVDHAKLKMDSNPEIHDVQNIGYYLFTGISNGQHNLTVWLVNSTNDTFTNSEATHSILFTIDTSPPNIFNITTSVTNITGTLSWTTTENADSRIAYDKNASALSSNIYSSSSVTQHQIGITSLTNNTLYYYNITSCDTSRNCNTSGPNSFTTSSNPQPASCGDGTCNGGESCATCSSDCGNCPPPDNNNNNNNNEPDPPENESTNLTTSIVITPPTALRDNQELRDISEGIIDIPELTDDAVEDLISFSEAIISDFTGTRYLFIVNGDSELVLKLKYNGNSNLINLMVYDIIPKEFTNNVTSLRLYVPYGNYEVVNPDPEFMFSYPKVRPGEEITISYTVETEVDFDIINKTNTSLFAEGIEEIPDCNNNGVCDSGVETIDNCPGDCFASSCTPGEKRCNNDTVELCNVQGTGWNGQFCEFGCNQVGLTCNETPVNLGDLTGVIGVILVIMATGALGGYFIYTKMQTKKPSLSTKLKIKPEKKIKILKKPLPKGPVTGTPIDSSLRDINDYPKSFIGRRVRVRGSIIFSNEFKATRDMWYTMDDGTSDILIYSTEKGIRGSGILVGVVERTGNSQLYIKMETFRRTSVY